MSTTSEIPKRIKKPWLEPSVGDLIVFSEDYSKYEGLIISVTHTISNDITSEHMYSILWIEDGRITTESSSRIRENYTLLENDSENK